MICAADGWPTTLCGRRFDGGLGAAGGFGMAVGRLAKGDRLGRLAKGDRLGSRFLTTYRSMSLAMARRSVEAVAKGPEGSGDPRADASAYLLAGLTARGDLAGLGARGDGPLPISPASDSRLKSFGAGNAPALAQVGKDERERERGESRSGWLARVVRTAANPLPAERARGLSAAASG